MEQFYDIPSFKGYMINKLGIVKIEAHEKYNQELNIIKNGTV